MNYVTPSPERRSPTKALKNSRGESMLNALRGELEKLPCLIAVHQRRQSPDKQSSDTDPDKDNVFIESGTEDESTPSERRKLKKQHSFQTRRASSITPALSEAELQKLQMIQTLTKMGATPRRLSRKGSMMSESGEAAVMEASYGMRKRGSIATRVMLVAAKRKPATQVDPNAQKLSARKSQQNTPAVRPDPEDLSEDQKQKSQKVLDLFKKPEKLKLPAIVGKNKANVTQEEVAVDVMNTFRRKLKRKKVRLQY